MEAQAKAIAELREKFLKKLDDEGPPDPSVYKDKYKISPYNITFIHSPAASISSSNFRRVSAVSLLY